MLHHGGKYPQNTSLCFFNADITFLNHKLSFKFLVNSLDSALSEIFLASLAHRSIRCLDLVLCNFFLQLYSATGYQIMFTLGIVKLVKFCNYFNFNCYFHFNLYSFYNSVNVNLRKVQFPSLYRSNHIKLECNSSHKIVVINFKVDSTFSGLITLSCKTRILELHEIRTKLFIAGIEVNPGPNQVQSVPIISLDIFTINCNGLTSDHRLLQAIGKIKKHIKHRNAIIFLQESHNANIVLLESIWTGSVNVSIGSGGSRGVITLCTENFKVEAFKADSEGRYLFTTIKVNDNYFINSANFYSPNNHDISKQFILDSFRDWEHFCSAQADLLPSYSMFSSVIAGDFNCVLNKRDLQNRSWSNKEALLAEVINRKLEEYDLFDSVLRSPNGNNFTWNRGDIFSKLDYIFVSADLLEKIITYNTIWDLIKSDHAAIKLSISLDNSCKRGRSYPKLYLADLKGEGTVEAIRDEISKAIADFPNHWTPHQQLDFIKLVIRTNILEIRAKNKVSNESIDSLKDELNSFNVFSTLTEQQIDRFNYVRAKLYQEEGVQAEKLRIMAGVKWIEEGERSTKFFLNAINTRRASSTVDYLNTSNGPVYSMKDILSFSKEFYSNLYAKVDPQPVDGFYDLCPSLSDSAKLDLNNALSIMDLKTALRSCKDSTPGLDGIPYSFYKIFGNQLLPLLLKSWNYSILTSSLPQSQTTSVISLIPKDGKDKHDIKNWRPISISTCDLKIITKALSTKVGNHIGEIISDSQMGYVPGRDINFNNRLMKAALDYCNSNNLDYIITSLDAQKAYDSLDHEYISKTLKAYDFPDSFITAVNLLHNNLIAHVQVNGFLSDRFDINRGVKQGDALSCALFIICIDPLIRNIEQNPNIPALDITQGCAVKTLAYADDVAIITLNDNEVTQNIFNEYNKLTNMSGLVLNADKTEILNLCPRGKQLTCSVYDNTHLEISHKSSITICGNHLSLDSTIAYEHNISDKIAKLIIQLNKWKGRNLSINGKMIIVKTFAISQLIFSSQFQTIRIKDLKRIEHLAYSFIWNGPDRAKRGILKAGKPDGGIYGIDVESFFYSIVIRQFLKSYSYSKLKCINDCPILREDIKTQARTILRKLLFDQLSNCTIDSIESAKWVACLKADLLVKPYSKAYSILSNHNISTISSINPASLRRGTYNTIRRCLHPMALVVLDFYVAEPSLEPKILVQYVGKEIEIGKLSSGLLNERLKEVLNKVILYHPSNKYGIDKSYFRDIRSSWNNLWLINNPTLRAIRLKILYKDIWSQEKRYKLGISNNSTCTICGEIESSIHQLFLCSNAIRIWNIALNPIGMSFPANGMSNQSIADLIQVSNDLGLELVKSAIFKLLIQIDRSSNMNSVSVLNNISYWVCINLKAIRNKSRLDVNLINRLEGIMRNIGSPTQ